MHRSVAEAVGAKHGQSVIVRRIVPVFRKQKKMDLVNESNIIADNDIVNVDAVEVKLLHK